MSTTYTYTLDDSSPQIVWSAGWNSNTTADSAAQYYFDSSFHATSTRGATASFKFNGTGIAMFGAKRANHGTYKVTVDGQGALTESGTGDQLYQQQLFSTNNLDGSAEHEVVLENTGDSGEWLDLDYLVISWTPATALLSPTNIDDSGGLVTYNPPDSGLTNSTADWQTSSWVTQYTFNQTFHATTHEGYEVRIPFNGSSIQVFGGMGNNHGDYSVSLDGASPTTLNGYFFNGYFPKRQLFSASGLTDGQHEVVLANQATNGSYFDFDYAVVNTSTDWSKDVSSGGATGGVSSNASGSSKTSIGAIAGGVVGGVVAIALVALLVFLLRRRRSHRFGAVRTAEKEFSIDDNDPEAQHLGATNGHGAQQPLTPFTYSQTGSPSIGLTSPEATTAGTTTGSLFSAGETSSGPNGAVVGNPLRLVSTPPPMSPDALESSSGRGQSSIGEMLTKGQMAERERESQGGGGSQGARRERDEDAGPVPAHEAEPFLPPAYEQATGYRSHEQR